MFGFVRPLRGELKVREWERFQSVYCGLCHTIRRRYGFMQTMMLSYDCTYLALVLDALEPSGGEQCKRRCVMHPFRRRTCAASSDGMIRAAAVSVILCWHKLADTIADDRGAKRLAAKIFRLFLRRGYRKAAAELPDPEGICDKYPHELSGGMLQRAMIAAAIVNRPKLLLLDEPTTALDVTIQAQILEMLKKLNRESGVSMLFISHNLNVVRKLCRRVAVMQRGVLVEEGDTDQVFYHPQHPYTQKLIDAIPTRNRKEERP